MLDLDELFAEIRRMQARQMALELVCASLITEVVVATPNPSETHDRLVTSLQGIAAGVAHGVGSTDETQAVTVCIERIAALSEAALVRRRSHG